MPKLTVTLTTREQELILAALQACAPSGGGSECFSLMSQLSWKWNIIPEDRLIGQLQMAAYDEVREHVVDMPAAREHLLTRGM